MSRNPHCAIRFPGVISRPMRENRRDRQKRRIKRLYTFMTIFAALGMAAALSFRILCAVENRFAGGTVTPSGYINGEVGFELDLVPGMAYAGSNVEQGDYNFAILGREWFRLYFMPEFNRGMEVQIRLRNVGDSSHDFIVARTVADYRRQGFDFYPTGELAPVIRESGTRHRFSVFRRRELILRDIAEAATYLFIRRHGNVMIQIIITRYDPIFSDHLIRLLQSIRIYNPERSSPELVASTDSLDREYLSQATSRLSDAVLNEMMRNQDISGISRYAEYLGLYGFDGHDFHRISDPSLLADYNPSQLRRVEQLFPDLVLHHESSYSRGRP